MGRPVVLLLIYKTMNLATNAMTIVTQNNRYEKDENQGGNRACSAGTVIPAPAEQKFRSAEMDRLTAVLQAWNRVEPA